MSGTADKELRELYLIRRSHMLGFTATLTCLAVSVRIGSYQLVSQLNRIREWRPAGESAT